MQRLWFFTHFAISFLAAKISFHYIQPDRVGKLDARSVTAYHYFHIFYVAHAIAAIGLFVVLRKSQGPLNAVLTIAIIIWTGLMFLVTELAGTTL